VGGLRVLSLDLGRLPAVDTDPSAGSVSNMVPALTANNFNYGVQPATPLPPYLTDVAAGKPFVIIALAVPRFADIKQENNVAHATVNLKDEQIQLTMAQTGDRWRVTAVQDEKLARMLAQAMVNNLPTNGGHIQDELQRQLNNLPIPGR